MTIDKSRLEESTSSVTSSDDFDERLGTIAALVQSAAASSAQLWREERIDGDRTARLIEVSHALHRAALALSDVELIGHDTRPAPDPHSASVAPGDSTPPIYDRKPRTEGDANEGWRLLVDAVDEYAIFMLDPIGAIVTWNVGAQRIMGYNADEIIGRHFSVFYTADDISADKPQRHLAHAAEHHHCQDDGWRVRHGGTRFSANVVITALVDSDGQLTGFANITRDETDRNQPELRARRLQQLTDREELAENLADTITHGLFTAGLDMQSALQLITDPLATQRVQHAVEILDDTIKQIRNVALDRGDGSKPQTEPVVRASPDP